MNAINHQLASELAKEFDLPQTPAEELERAADGYRRSIEACMRRASDARKACASTVQEVEDERGRLDAVYHQDMARLDAEVVAAKASAAAEITAVNKLAEASRTALEALQS
ncbi:hypothetical protein ASD64_07235 [Mesorhizobium sp. Root157]|uniref:hypothetical protein n=1 Tax=Mesorhizobium sp. Root157 TaxID=1736477 RepID=UPI000700ADF1|nr:hypothetical protein [Mesorhizobium sp. Root157]KQZ87224.1 hypothetical protein ASD64_07235 [Mesorhizobium sp. Root157]